MKTYIYITTNLINNKKYIGKRTGEFDKNYYGSGNHLRNALHKYGRSNFQIEIVKWFDDETEAYKYEFELIKENNAVKSNEFYNMTDGGKGFACGENHPHHKSKGGAIFLKGKKFSDEHKKKLSQAKIGTKLTYEHRKNMSLSHIGMKHTKESIQKCRDAKLGIKLTDDHKRKLSLRKLEKNCICEHCGYVSNKSVYTRYHGDLCSKKF